MSDSVAQDMIRAFFERWQRLEEEKVAISGDLKELFAEAKANGFDTKVLRVVFRDKVADQNAKSEFEAVYDIYWSALGTPRATGAGRAHEDGTPDHDPVTGEIHEPDAAMLPQTAGSETAVATEPETTNGGRHETAAHPEPYVIPGRRRDADRGNGPDMAAAQTGELQRQVQSETDHEPAEGSAEETSEPIRRMSMTPLEPREAGGLKGFGFTVRFDEPEAAMLPQTAGSETAVANSTPGSGAGTVDAGEANWPSEMTTASPANEPETIPPVADPATVVSEAGGGDSAPSLAAIPVADRSQPNPICRDPDDCGVYASWAMPCQVCKAAAAHRSAA